MLALASGVYFQRVYRHPTVVQISNDPATLLTLEPEDLGIARKRLARAGRLDWIRCYVPHACTRRGSSGQCNGTS
jgi:hypothetical protein